MVGAGIGVTLIPEMAVAVETRSASVSVARFRDPQPSRTIGMIWRKTSPLARQLLQISEVVCHSADALREQHKAATANHGPERSGFAELCRKRSGARNQVDQHVAWGAARSSQT